MLSLPCIHVSAEDGTACFATVPDMWWWELMGRRHPNVYRCFSATRELQAVRSATSHISRRSDTAGADRLKDDGCTALHLAVQCRAGSGKERAEVVAFLMRLGVMIDSRISCLGAARSLQRRLRHAVQPQPSGVEPFEAAVASLVHDKWCHACKRSGVSVTHMEHSDQIVTSLHWERLCER